ncbi:MAG: hypothetical protein OEW68_15755, partial [Gammaproteobacteria bacterium]|nr:hypothetical protein [Gammaproteobacteria bacterium]
MSVIGMNSASAEIGEAIAYLESRQSPDGFWIPSPAGYAGKLDTTLQSALALSSANGGDSLGVQAARSALASLPTDSLAHLALKSLIENSPTSASESIDILESSQNADGGWGAAAGYQSQIIETAYVVSALYRWPAPEGFAFQSGLFHLASRQSNSGAG